LDKYLPKKIGYYTRVNTVMFTSSWFRGACSPGSTFRLSGCGPLFACCRALFTDWDYALE